MRKVYFFLIRCIVLFSFSPTHVDAQGEVDTLYRIAEVDITAQRLHRFGVGSALAQVDSVDLSLFRAGHLGQLLAQQGLADMRLYGPGGIATASIRGGSTSQTTVLWEGIPLQSPMNGVADLALIPVSLLESVTMQSGASGAIGGNAAMGGSIHLSSRKAMPTQQGIHAEANMGFGSFGSDGQSAKLHLGGQRFASTSAWFRRYADNEFTYRETGQVEVQQMQQASFFQQGLMQQLAWVPAASQRVHLHMWAGTSSRNLPPRAFQEDRFLRVASDWQAELAGFSLSARVGLNAESLLYRDTLAGLDELHLSQGLFSQIGAERRVGLHDVVELSLQHVFQQAQSRSLSTDNLRSMPGLLASWRHEWLGQRWISVLNMRKDWPSQETAPWMPGIGIEGRLTSRLRVQGRFDRCFRLPTFNERFWVPGGNPDLRPERGYQAQSSLLGEQGPIQWEIGTFWGRTEDWIFWRPVGNVWTPLNIREVVSYGLQAKVHAVFDIGWGTLTPSALSSWTHTQTVRSTLPRDAAVGQQLLYVPRNKANLSLRWEHQTWMMAYDHQWTGHRNISTDGEYQLPAFHLGRLQLRKTIAMRAVQAEIDLSADNLWNTSYQWIAGQPMPLRSFQVGISFTFHSSFASL